MTTAHMIALDRALAEFSVPPPQARRWAGQLAETARQMRAVLTRHRDIVPSSIGILPGAGRALRCHEGVLAIMRAGGLPDGRAVAGLRLLWIIVNGFSLEETRAAALDPPVASQFVAALPADRFPNLVAVAGEFTNTSADDLFELLIAIFITGLAGNRDSHDSGPPGPVITNSTT